MCKSLFLVFGACNGHPAEGTISCRQGSAGHQQTQEQLSKLESDISSLDQASTPVSVCILLCAESSAPPHNNFCQPPIKSCPGLAVPNLIGMKTLGLLHSSAFMHGLHAKRASQNDCKFSAKNDGDHRSALFVCCVSSPVSWHIPSTFHKLTLLQMVRSC